MLVAISFDHRLGSSKKIRRQKKCYFLMIISIFGRQKSPPLEGRVVVTWDAARSAEIFFLGLITTPCIRATLTVVCSSLYY